MSRKEKRFFYIEYTALFLFFASIILYFYYVQGKSMINYGGDGYRQHFRALLYYSNYLKDLISSFLKGCFIIPQWDFSISEGADILETFHYYCIGDVFTFFSFLCPEKYMYIYYDISTLLRMYFCGIVFSILCIYKGKRNTNVLLVGSILYAFSAFTITSMSGHVFFISAAVFLPLIILGTEMIINNDNPFLLSFAVMFSALSNIYFFYMNVISTVLFVVTRILLMKEDIDHKFRKLFIITMYSLIGVLMSCVVFLPMLNSMIHNSRLETSVSSGFLFPLNNYISNFKQLSFNGTYVGGFSVLWIFGLSCLFTKKKNKTLIALLLVSFLFVNIPFFSSIYNAFAYPTDRWCYAVSLLVLYIVVDSFENIDDINSCLHINVILLILYYGLCLYLDRSYWQVHVLLFVLSSLLLFTIKLISTDRLRSLIVIIVVCLNMMFQLYYKFSPQYWGVSRQGTELLVLNNMDKDEHSVFDKINDDSFFRYSGYEIKENESIQSDYSSTQYYWSIVNNYVIDFRKEYGLLDRSLHHYDNYDERFALNVLAGVKYYINNEKKNTPYGFDYVDNINNYYVFKSRFNLPLVFAYDNYITYDKWKLLSLEEKNEALLQALVTDKDLDVISAKSLKFDNKSIEYSRNNTEGITISGDSIISEGKNSIIALECDNHEAGEYYVAIKGLYSDKATSYINVNYKGIEKYIIHKDNNNKHFTDRHNYIVNLGYYDGIEGTINIMFTDSASYQFDAIEVICQPLDHQIEFIEKLKDIEINSLDVNENAVNTDVFINENKIVCFSIPYSKGWKAYVDGKEVELLNCNVQYMGIELEQGTHTIELKYSTPLLKEGTIISFISIVVFMYLIIKNKKENDKMKV